jgi:hypothetical protein
VVELVVSGTVVVEVSNVLATREEVVESTASIIVVVGLSEPPATVKPIKAIRPTPTTALPTPMIRR